MTTSYRVLITDAEGEFAISSAVDVIIDWGSAIDGRAQIAFSALVEIPVVARLHRLRTSRVPFKVDCGTHFSAERAVIQSMSKWGNVPPPLLARVTLEIRALKVVDKRDVAPPTPLAERAFDIAISDALKRLHQLMNSSPPVHVDTTLTLEQIYPVTAPHLRDLRDVTAPIEKRRAAADWLTMSGFDEHMMFSDGEVLRDVRGWGARLAELATPSSSAAVCDAIGCVFGVTHVELHDCSTDAWIPSGEVALVIDGGDPAEIATAMYRSLPCGVVLRGTTRRLVLREETYEARWFTSVQWNDHVARQAATAGKPSKLDAAEARFLEQHLADTPPPMSFAELREMRGRRLEASSGHAPDPLDVEIDGWKLRTLLAISEEYRQDRGMSPYPPSRFTPAQRAGVSAHWSAQLRAKVAETRADDKAREISVIVDLEEP